MISPVQLVPMEIWQKVFVLAFNSLPSDDTCRVLKYIGTGPSQDKTDRGHRFINSLRRVSQFWNSAILNECSIWASLPHLKLYGSAESRPKLKALVQLYISRSGTVPISFSLMFGPLSVPDREIVGLLMAVSDRWKEAEFHIPIEEVGVLAPVRGKLANLSSLRLEGMPEHHRSRPTSNIDCFQDAPRLRHVSIEDFEVGFPPVNPPHGGWSIFLNLPWSQLETFKVRPYQPKDTYAMLANVSGANLLRTLNVSALSAHGWTGPVTFLRLTSLSLRLGALRLGELSLISSMTLPSLEDLEIRGNHDRGGGDDGIWGSILLLVKQSSCSLRRLTVDERSDLPIPSGPLLEILSLSPEMTHLDLGTLGTDVLQKLCFHTDNPSNLIPHLQFLTIRQGFGNDANEADPAPAWLLDGRLLMEMMKSRTTGLPRNHINATNSRSNRVTEIGVDRPALQEIRFLCRDFHSSRRQLDFCEACDRRLQDGQDETEFSKLMSEWRPFLKKETLWNPEGPDRLKVVRIMSEMISMDLSDKNTMPALRLGIINLLSYISLYRSYSNLADLATTVCLKWKGPLLRDYRASRLRWCHPNKGLTVLKYVEPQMETLDDHTVWLDILGCHCFFHSEERKRPWQWV